MSPAVSVGPGVPPTMGCPEAACRRADPALFYPEQYRTRYVAAAKLICASCPIRTACLAWALTNERFGVQGGLTPKERGRLGGVTYDDARFRRESQKAGKQLKREER